tara:strand:+ start:92 stop:1345 length:1254 start_codon:yes stop_codon:yes gene_type:complete
MNNFNGKTKICFVIMGFGKKTDPDLGKTYDLDKTYKNIIRPSVIEAGYECVRADEVLDSGLIDKSMYALLMQADLVVADITTFNPNAIYELGIRHGVRPYSTIILKEKNGKIPFDLDHNRMCLYSHLGEDIGVDEAERCKAHLVNLIKSVSTQGKVDSPLYEFIQNINPPILPENEYISLIDDLAEKEKLIFAVVEKAKKEMHEGNFNIATQFWKKASDSLPSEPYFVQQLALCTYKSKIPSEHAALNAALIVISKLSPENQTTNDPETLGITGAIYKNLWRVTRDESFLSLAIEYYGKCFNITGDYYTGENYALCLDEKSILSKDNEEKIYNRMQAKKSRQKIIDHLNEVVLSEDFDARLDRLWIYATLSHCGLANDHKDSASKYEKLFLSESPSDWQIDTFNKSKEELIRIKEVN